MELALAVAGVALFALGAAAFFVVRGRSAAAEVSWVASKDGLVEFSPAGTRLFAWDQVAACVAASGEVHVTFARGARPTVFSLGEHAPIGGSVRLRAAQLAGAGPAAFADMVNAARTDAEARRRLPTFAHPEGPPEAVLAEFE